MASHDLTRVVGRVIHVVRLPIYGRVPTRILGAPQPPTGHYRVFGTTRVQGVATPLRVRLLRDDTGAFVAETWSDADGHYQFDSIPGGLRYLALAQDHTGQWLPAAVDRIVPAPMEQA